MHPDEDRLLQHTLGQLTGDAAAEIDEHLRGCEACRHRQENLSSIVFAKTVPGSTPGPLATPTKPDEQSAPPLGLERGTPLGRYVLISRLGAGGMGEVFSAYDPQLDRRVAIKLLRAGSLSAEEGKARLLREAQAMARLQHPNVIAVHDVGTFGDRVFIAMEFVEGETLGEWLRGERDWRDTVRIFLQAGSGLAAAHRAGLVHRDFKPDNVLLGHDGRPRVLDFGLARQATSTPGAGSRPTPLVDTPAGDAPLGSGRTALTPSRAVAADGGPRPSSDPAHRPDSSSFAQPLTRDGAVMGTPGYMAPEQLSGLPTDARSDQFSFCVAVYEALYGKRPFGGATLKQHAQEIADGVVPPPPATSSAPTWVYDVLKRGLAANPSARWSDMDALLDALRPKARAGGMLTVLVAALAVLGLVAGGYAAYQQHQRTSLCGGSEKRLAGVWDAPTRARIETAFRGTKLSFAPDVWRNVEKALDAWALDWVNASREACEAHKVRHVDTVELNEMKSACLDERLKRLEALANLMSAADRDMVANATIAARSLEPVASCFDLGALRSHREQSDDLKEKAADVALHEKIAEARTLFDAGKYARGIELLRAALNADNPPHAASEAYLLLGRLQVRAGDLKNARASYLLAAEQGLKGDDARLQAIAFSRLHGSEADDPDKGAARGDRDDWDRLARAAAARVPTDWEVKAELTANDALVEFAALRLKAALTDYERLLQLQEEHLGAQHPEVAMTLNNLGVVHTALGDFEQAIAQYERSFALHQSLEGPEHPNSASAEHNLAYVLRRQGRYAEAAGHYEHALSVRRAALGPEHPETLKTADALAIVCTATGKHDRALELLQENLAIRQRLYGERSKETVQTYDFLADLYKAGRFWKEALTWAQLGLEVVQETSGPRSKQAGTAWFTLGGIQTQLGQWADAKRSLDLALSIRKEKFGDESNEVAAALNAQADLLLAQRRHAEALLGYQKALEVRRKALASTAESKAADLLGIGRSLMLLERPAEAVAPLEEAVSLQRGVENHAELAALKTELARAVLLSSPDRRAEALAMLREAAPDLSDEARRELDAWVHKNGVKELSDGGIDAGR